MKLIINNCTANQVAESNYNAAPTITRSFAINKNAQTITFAAPAARPLGTLGIATPPTAAFTVTATASSGLAVSFTTTSPTVCSLAVNAAGIAAGADVTLLTIGTCVLVANQAGDATTAAATAVSRSFAISKNAQTINFSTSVLVNQPLNVPTPLLNAQSASASSGLPVVFTATSATAAVCTLATTGTGAAAISTITLIKTGSCTIAANQAGNTTTYLAAPQVTRSFTVTAAVVLTPQAITNFTSTPASPVTYAPAPNNTATLSATGGQSGNAVTFASTTSSVCTTSGANNTTLTILSAGTCTLTANQAAGGIYSAAPPVTASLTINKMIQRIVFGALPDKTINDAPFSVNATATSGLTVALSSATPQICTITNATVTLVTVGLCTINADQAGDGNTAAAATVTQTFTVSAAQAKLYYIHPDHLGTPRVITTSDVASTKVWEWKNDDAFGANLPNENPSGLGAFPFNQRFPGQYYDAETGTYYNYFRDYDPSLGRYVQSDPIGLTGGLNSFSYVSGMPLTLIDPMGLCETAVWRGGFIMGWKPCNPSPPASPKPPSNTPSKSKCDPCNRASPNYNFDIPDADFNGLIVPRTPKSGCMTKCSIKAFGKFIGKEAIVSCLVEPKVSSALGHTAGKALGLASVGYGTYALTTDIMKCDDTCDSELNPPLAPGLKYSER